MSRRNILPILTVYARLNCMMFLLRFLLGGGIDVNSIFSLKPLILSAFLYAGEALSKYSLLKDILDILLLTQDGICLVIVGGRFDCLLM